MGKYGKSRDPIPRRTPLPVSKPYEPAKKVWKRPKSEREGRAEAIAKQIEQGVRKPTEIPAGTDVGLVEKKLEGIQIQKQMELTRKRYEAQGIKVKSIDVKEEAGRKYLVTTYEKPAEIKKPEPTPAIPAVPVGLAVPEKYYKEPARETYFIPPKIPPPKIFVGTGVDLKPIYMEVPAEKLFEYKHPLGLPKPVISEVRKAPPVTGTQRLQEMVGGKLETVAPSLYPFVAGAVSVPYTMVTHPIQTAKGLISPVAWYQTGKRVVTGVKEADPRVVGELLGMVALAKAPKVIGKGVGIGTRIATRISPRYRPVTRIYGKEFIERIPTEKGLKQIEIAKPVSQLTESLAEQIKITGRTVDVVSAQRALFGRIFKRKVEIEKPKLLEAPQLERALFGDPYGRLRISRLGIMEKPKKAGIRDILSGDITLRRERPQALIFPDVTIAKFPKHLKGIERKLRAGKPLTQAERLKLERWQMKAEGRFKPIGFLSLEPEVTLALHEIIRKKRVPAVTLIKKRRVPIIETEIVKPTKRTKQLLEKQRTKRLTPQELAELKRRLKKETRLDISGALETRPYLAPSRLPLLIPSRLPKRPKRISYKPAVPKEPYKPIPIPPSKPTVIIQPKLSEIFTPITPKYKKPKVPRIPKYPLQKLFEPSFPLPPRRPQIPIKPSLFKDFEILERKKVKKKLKKPKRAYQPSVGAVILEIEAKKIPKQIYTGLELRPQIIPRKTKRYSKRLKKALNL